MKRITYSEALLDAFNYLLENHKNVFIIGQGLWSPWYVGNSMTDLDKKFGNLRVINTPVSENAVTGAAIGASLCGMNPIVIHPRMDFMMYAMDPIINQAAKWSYMFGGQAHPQVTIRGIINRGGEQGAQHSQALHSLFAHIPGLRVVMPYSVSDARDLLIASVLCKDPVLFVDDRWLYSEVEEVGEIKLLDLKKETSKLINKGNDLTIVSSSYSTKIALEAAKEISKNNQFSIDLIDLRVINPIDIREVVKSVNKTKRLLVIDSGWKSCGLASYIISSVVEEIEPGTLKSKPINLSLPNCTAPTSGALEKIYYPKTEDVIKIIQDLLDPS